MIFIAKKKELTKEERIKREETRLRQSYKNLSKEKLDVVDGLIIRAAFMRIILDDCEKDIAENGMIENFTQSENVAPYERKRPVAELYNTMNKNYQSIIRQLSDLLPKEAAQTGEDEFKTFVGGRDD